MKNLNKKEFIISLVLIFNTAFLTIPYTFKNMSLEKEIRLLNTKNKSIAKPDKDFYQIYSNFNNILDELDIKIISKEADFETGELKISLILNSDMNIISNLLISINKKIPDMAIISANIESDKSKQSEMIFYIKN